MSTFTPTNKSSQPTYTNQSKSGDSTHIGYSMGLLLAITYGALPNLTFAPQSKASQPTYTNINKS